MNDLDQVYSPRRVRFLLAHFEELETLAQFAATSANLRIYLAHEWALLQTDQTHRDCLCPLGETTPPESPGRGSAFGDGAHGTQHLLADLRTAADQLPIHWMATQRVYVAQGRAGEWRFRHGIYQRGADRRPQERLIEPVAGSYLQATVMMATALGWRAREAVIDESGKVGVS